MGNNQAYSTFQTTVIKLYDRGKLDLELLDELAKEYSNTDIDSGGDTGLLAKDGKDLETLCIGIVDPAWTLGEPTAEELAGYNDLEDWQGSTRYDKWSEITDERWGWC